MKKKSNYDGRLNYNMFFEPTCLYIRNQHNADKEPLFGRQVKDMKTKSNYDGSLNYNKFFKPTCLHIKY